MCAVALLPNMMEDHSTCPKSIHPTLMSAVLPLSLLSKTQGMERDGRPPEGNVGMWPKPSSINTILKLTSSSLTHHLLCAIKKMKCMVYKKQENLAE
jgi:hypothetical protein